jgi:glycerol kinase
MEQYILALDAGTTSNRAILFDQHGKIVGTSQREFEQFFPQPGWVEHKPEEIWATQKFVARDVLKSNQIQAQQIAGIGITNQRETAIIWDRKTGEPVYNAIVWQDRRTADYCDALKAQGKNALIQEKTGLLIDAYFSATKIRWILENVDGVRARAEKGELAFGTVDTWLVWRLTHGKVHVTDVSNASRTLLLNIHTQQWDDELLELFSIPRSLLPEVRASSEVYGHTISEHFGVELPVAGIAGDQQAALFGQMCTERGMSKNTYGTGCFVMMNTGTEAIRSNHQLLTTIAWKVNGEVHYALEGSIFIGGAVVQWLRDQLQVIQRAEEVEVLAASVPDNGGVYFVPGFVGLGAPHWDPYATGTIVGLSRGTGKAHLARAALESIAMQTRDVIETMQKDAGIDIVELRVDGGAASNNLLMQIQSDFLQSKVVRPKVTETTALGAAYLAGLAVGYWPDLATIQAQWEEDRVFQPEIKTSILEKHLQRWNKALDRAKDWRV